MSSESGSRETGRVVVIDDEPVIQDVLGEVLRGAGYEVEVASDAAQATAAIETDTDRDVVLLDVMLPDADGMDLLRWLRGVIPEVSVVLVTAFGTVENAVSAMKLGAFHYLRKPFKNDEVRLITAQAVAATRLRRENRSLRRQLEDRHRFERIIGKSRPMQDVFRFIEQVAPSRSTVLIQGESGTGKELVAQAIHRRSQRTRHPFVVVNSNSIPTDLLEDNLFGHARGAFTGATHAKPGLLETAAGGTILFDEISTVSPEVQAKLLRVIQEKQFLPLGALESRTVDVRILAATNENLRELVTAGRFREDLFYRLNVISVTLPPLRERMEDIPLLLEHFLARCNEENGKSVSGVAPEVLERFLGYKWPGNVRELENVVERGVVLARSDRITEDLLPAEMRDLPRIPGAPALPAGLSLHEAVLRYERQLIEAALRRSGGVQKTAAEALGLKPTTLHEKIKRLRIEV